ncbi:MAG TPA: hypothetical protein VFT58_06005, partial [Nitrososphaera sp.]|nr:hypothetical protein [Nitrososphaera sp.]
MGGIWPFFYACSNKKTPISADEKCFTALTERAQQNLVVPFQGDRSMSVDYLGRRFALPQAIMWLPLWGEEGSLARCSEAQINCRT